MGLLSAAHRRQLLPEEAQLRQVDPVRRAARAVAPERVEVVVRLEGDRDRRAAVRGGTEAAARVPPAARVCLRAERSWPRRGARPRCRAGGRRRGARAGGRRGASPGPPRPLVPGERRGHTTPPPFLLDASHETISKSALYQPSRRGRRAPAVVLVDLPEPAVPEPLGHPDGQVVQGAQVRRLTSQVAPLVAEIQPNDLLLLVSCIC